MKNDVHSTVALSADLPEQESAAVEYCTLKRNYEDMPEGFIFGERGVVWAQGRRYTTDGCNPYRVEVLWLFRGQLCESWESPSARAATREEAHVWVAKIKAATDRRIAATKAACDDSCASIDATARWFERQLSKACNTPRTTESLIGNSPDDK